MEQISLRNKRGGRARPAVGKRAKPERTKDTPELVDSDDDDFDVEPEWSETEIRAADSRRLQTRRAIELAMENRALQRMLADFPDD